MSSEAERVLEIDEGYLAEWVELGFVALYKYLGLWEAFEAYCLRRDARRDGHKGAGGNEHV